ncbi:hypothetical protein JHK87_027459 [Glycine soja]|nr:hypothetical protein JHK87_027459 [Glycine soja]
MERALMLPAPTRIASKGESGNTSAMQAYLFKRWSEHLDNTCLRVSQPPLKNCDFCGGEHYNDNCHMYSMNNFGWGRELSPYNQYEEERTPSLESVFEEFMAYHASSKADQTSMINQELQFGKSYSIEDYQGGLKLQPYNQNEAERGSNLDNLLMQFKETTESTQQTFKSAEIQVGKLAEEVTQFVARREEDLVEVEAQEESPVKEHESREKDEEKGEEKVQQWGEYSTVENQQESILQINTFPRQLIVKEER